MLRILQVLQKPQLRGAEIFASQLGEKLNSVGMVNHIAFVFGNTNELLKANNTYYFLHGNPSKRFFDVSAYRNLNQIINSGGYDIVQANAGDTLKYAANSKYLYNWKQPLVFRNANYISGFINNRLKKWINSLWVRNCAHIISVSETCRKDFVSVFPSLKNSSITIPIGTYLFDEIKPATLELENGLGGPVFINIGSFVPEKNHLGLIDIFNAYHKTNKKGQLWIVGDGLLRQQIEKKINRYGLSDVVKLLGYRDDVISFIKAADVMLMPSFIEGLPGVILEAMACRKPVIAYNVGGISEAISQGESGILIEKNDTSAYLSAMESLTENLTLRDKMGTIGCTVVEKHFTMDKIAIQFIKTYEQILANR